MGASSNLADETQTKGRAKTSGWIGIAIQDVSEKIAGKLKLDAAEGAYVKEVVKNSPADSAGIQKGDVIVEYSQKKIFDSDELVKAVRRTEPGTKTDIILVRDGKKLTLQLIVEKRKASNYRTFGPMPNIPDVHMFIGNRILGLQLLTLNEQLGEYFGAPNNEGVLVEEVEHESAAEKAGFKAGDIIIRISKKTVDAVEKVQRELRKYDEGEKVEFEVLRKGANKTLSIEMEEEQGFPYNFYFRKPHFRMFRMDPFDDADMRFEMDDLQSNLNQAQIELRKSIKGLKGMPDDISNHLKHFGVPRPEEFTL
jgi:serine protease Do